jgi:DNA-binding CsgD family transcriptional regulator
MGLGHERESGDSAQERTAGDFASCEAVAGVRSRRFRFCGDEHWVLSFSLEPPIARLTGAETVIAEAILVGASNSEIARERGRSINTVANQIAALFKKVGVRSRQELVVALARCPSAEASVPPADGQLRWFARAVLRAQPPSAGAAALAGLAGGKWKIIDHFDSDAQRYVIACRSPSPLSVEERELVQRRARGDSVKEIAIDLSVSSATISRRLTRALHKLGLVSHVELPRLFAAARAA